MKTFMVAVALVASLSACATGDRFAEREATAKEVPIRFAHGQIRGDQVDYKAATDQRRGTNVRQATFVGDRGEFATFALMGTLGDYAFSRRDTRQYVEGIIKDDSQIEWGASGDVHQGARQTGYKAFRLRTDRQTCVGVQRSLAEHRESAPGDHSQLLLIGIYCRPGSEPIGRDEIRTMVNSLQA
jgi:hypothetical protein